MNFKRAADCLRLAADRAKRDNDAADSSVLEQAARSFDAMPDGTVYTARQVAICLRALREALHEAPHR